MDTCLYCYLSFWASFWRWIWSMAFSAVSLMSCINQKLFLKVVLLWYLQAFLQYLEVRQETDNNVKRLQCCGFLMLCISPWQSQSVCHYFNCLNHLSSFLFWIHLNALKKTFPNSKLGCLITDRIWVSYVVDEHWLSKEWQSSVAGLCHCITVALPSKLSKYLSSLIP